MYEPDDDDAPRCRQPRPGVCDACGHAEYSWVCPSCDMGLCSMHEECPECHELSFEMPEEEGDGYERP